MQIQITLSDEDWQKVKMALLVKANQEAQASLDLGLRNNTSAGFTRIYEQIDATITRVYGKPNQATPEVKAP